VNTPPPRIVVTAAIVERNGRFLVTRRPRGVHLEGLWEFPGGKCEPDESHQACLQREIVEELGTAIEVLSEVFAVTHEYPDRIVELHFFQCGMTGDPQPLLGQEIRWVTGDGLLDLEFPPADAELIALLRSAR
jgi:8-oxo-dGTP diphosphatase